jgi:predicted NAD/FAD-dependent oxidoreductase
MAKTVLIVGGGVAGMSAAHQFVEREFEVDIIKKAKRLCRRQSQKLACT